MKKKLDTYELLINLIKYYKTEKPDKIINYNDLEIKIYFLKNKSYETEFKEFQLSYYDNQSNTFLIDKSMYDLKVAPYSDETIIKEYYFNKIKYEKNIKNTKIYLLISFLIAILIFLTTNILIDNLLISAIFPICLLIFVSIYRIGKTNNLIFKETNLKRYQFYNSLSRAELEDRIINEKSVLNIYKGKLNYKIDVHNQTMFINSLVKLRNLKGSD